MSKINWLFSIFTLVFMTIACTKSEEDVYPAAANKLKNIELGEAIYLLMPDENNGHIEWSYQSNNKIIYWIDDTYKTNDDSTYSSRDGLMRINVKGVKSTILRKETKELAWSINYSNSISNPKFGPQEIELKPGIDDGDANCFGSTVDNCTFSPIESLIASNIHFEIICKTGKTENWGTTGLLLSAKGKKSVKAKWFTDGGSGGSSSSMYIYIGEEPENLCE